VGKPTGAFGHLEDPRSSERAKARRSLLPLVSRRVIPNGDVSFNQPPSGDRALDNGGGSAGMFQRRSSLRARRIMSSTCSVSLMR
jgi:hypothetical protein